VEAARAKINLERLTADYKGPTCEDADAAERAAKAQADATLVEAEAIEATLRAARARLDEQRHALAMARQVNESAKEHFLAVESVKAVVAAAATGPTADEDSVTAAAAATAAVERQLTDALVAAGFADKLNKAHATGKESLTHRAHAATLREAAKATDDVLADAIQCPVLRVEAGRLVTTTTRGRTLFAELSEGERWRIALDIAADQVGDGGIITVPQDAWEGLDASNRMAVAEHARRRLVTILTAEAQRNGEAEDLVAAAVAS
jgi:hypothetical protein